jgi:hypothetical protein
MRPARVLALGLLLAAAACGRADESAPASAASEREDAPAAAPTALPTPPVPPPPPPPPALALQLEGREEREVLAGTPLVLTVSLSANEDAPPAEVDDWRAQLRLEDAETGAALAWPVAPLGAPRVWIFAEAADPADEAEARHARLVPGRIYEAELGVGPEAAATLPPGTHAVRVALEHEALPAPARSEPVTLRVRGADEATPALERERRLATLRFALLAGRGEEAERLARELVAEEPGAVEAHLLLGEALEQLGRDDEAGAAYRDALERVPPRGRHEDPPTLLLERIDAVERRLAGPAPAPAEAPAP